MTENNWYKLKDQFQPAIESDNVNYSIKVKLLYDELMALKTQFVGMERTLRGEISYLHAKNNKLEEENSRLSDEVNSIKQALYFG